MCAKRKKAFQEKILKGFIILYYQWLAD